MGTYKSEDFTIEINTEAQLDVVRRSDGAVQESVNLNNDFVKIDGDGTDFVVNGLEELGDVNVIDRTELSTNTVNINTNTELCDIGTTGCHNLNENHLYLKKSNQWIKTWKDQ